MLWRELKTACCHSLMRTVHFLKDADKWQSYSPVCMICVVEIGVDEPIVAKTIVNMLLDAFL